MSAPCRPLPSLHNLLLLWAAILVICSTAVTATSSTVDNQSRGHFKNLTTPNVPDRNEERTLWPCVEGLVELFKNFDNFLMGKYPFKASKVDVYLKNTGLDFRARNSFQSQKFRKAVDKIIVLHSGNHMLAQEAIFKGLERATRAKDQEDMFFELGRTIGSYKPAGTTSTPSSPTIDRTESIKGHVGRDEAQEEQRRFVLGLEPHLLDYWVDRKYTPGAVWKGLKLDVRKSEPSFRVFMDFITHFEPNELVRYDEALKNVRRWSKMSSPKTVPDLVIAQHLVDAGAPNNADVFTTHLMEALFRDWEKRGMTQDQLFRVLLPQFTFEIQNLLQGPLKLWIKYFCGTENQASYKMLLHTIFKSEKSDILVDDRGMLVYPHTIEEGLVKMYSYSMRNRIQFSDTAAENLALRSKLFIHEVFRNMKRNGVSAYKMLVLLDIRRLKHMELMENPHLRTWMSFVIESYGDIKNFESADPEDLRIIALVKQDGNTIFNHLKEQLDDDELVTLVEEAIGWDQRFYYLFASNLANMWKSEEKTSHDVFLLLGLNVPVETLLTLDKFPLWFHFVIKTSDDEVKATLEMHKILKVMYDKDSSNLRAVERPDFDTVIEHAMSVTVGTRPKLCQCISKLWCVDLLNEGYDAVRYHIREDWVRDFFAHYLSTHFDNYGEKLRVLLPAGFS